MVCDDFEEQVFEGLILGRGVAGRVYIHGVRGWERVLWMANQGMGGGFAGSGFLRRGFGNLIWS